MAYDIALYLKITFGVKHDNTIVKPVLEGECRSEPRGENDVSVFADSEY